MATYDAEAFFNAATPVVVSNTSVRHWPAFADPKRWTPVSIASALGKLRVHVSSEPTIRLHSAVHPLASDSTSIRWLRRWEEKHITAAQFLGNEATGNASCTLPNSSYYYFAPLKDLPVEIQQGVGDTSALGSPFRPIMEVNLWMGGPGVTSPLHYDGVHNSFVQIHGYKRFVLFPPENFNELYLFPRLHPSSRQSQLDDAIFMHANLTSDSASASNGSPLHPSLNEPAANFLAFPQLVEHDSETARRQDSGSRAPRSATLTAMQEVVVGPGDILYIPP
jgi:hypothetical protein